MTLPSIWDLLGAMQQTGMMPISTMPMVDNSIIWSFILGAFEVLLVALGCLIRWAQVQQAKKTEEQGEMLVEILKQVSATNGRVIALETWRDAHQAEVGRIMGDIHHDFKQVWDELRRMQDQRKDGG